LTVPHYLRNTGDERGGRNQHHLSQYRPSKPTTDETLSAIPAAFEGHNLLGVMHL
jgi:hypothetical protein